MQPITCRSNPEWYRRVRVVKRSLIKLPPVKNPFFRRLKPVSLVSLLCEHPPAGL
jgi:hypothetical protein